MIASGIRAPSEGVYLLSLRLGVQINSVADMLRSLCLLTVSLKPPFTLNKNMENTEITKSAISRAALTPADREFQLEHSRVGSASAGTAPRKKLFHPLCSVRPDKRKDLN